MSTATTFRLRLGWFCTVLLVLWGCKNSGETSAKLAREHVVFLAHAAERDVGEVRRGMPAGAKALEDLFQEAAPERPAAAAARAALARVRARNNDLDSAKSTFFLVATADGTILRNNLDQDEMAEKNLFEAYPAAKQALTHDYLEFRGSWELARGVNGRPDAQWLAASRIVLPEDQTVGLFVSGWSWSSYAYRLEVALRSEILGNTKEGDKVPLTYVYVVVGDQAYGAPVSPVVNGEAIVRLGPHQKVQGAEVWSTPIEIERRTFGLALRKLPELGDDVVLAVLRSET